MRKRDHFVGLWLDDKAYSHLSSQCAVTGLSASAFVRQFIGGVQIRPRPPDEYAKLLREMSAICVVITAVSISLLHAVTARLKIEQVFKFYWTVVSGLALVSLVMAWYGL